MPQGSSSPERRDPPTVRRTPGGPTDLDSQWTWRERLSVAWDRAGIRWLVGILAAVVVTVGLLALRTAPGESVTAPQVIRTGSPVASGGPTASPVSAASASASTPGQSGVVVVHVAGPVRNPGVVTLPAGSRVADAIAAAGGMAKGPTRINLARVLIDGEQVDVGGPPDASDAGGSTSLPGAASGGSSGTSMSGGARPSGGQVGGQLSGKISLNRATASQLEQLPRVGPVLASKIIEFRTQHGGFRSVDQLREVSGIGDATFAQIAPHVQV